MNLQDLIGEKYTIVGSGKWLRTREHDSLVIDAERQIFFWNSKGISGDALFWCTHILGMDYKDAKNYIDYSKDISLYQIADNGKETLPTLYPALVDIFFERGKKHREYWYNVRGYTDQTINRFKLGYTGKWYTIPIYVKGAFKNFQIRLEEPKTIRYWYKHIGPHPFNFSILPTTTWAVLTEGPVDAIMLRQNDVPAVSQTGGSGHWDGRWVSDFSHIKYLYICYDNNKAGDMFSQKVGNYFGDRAKIYNFWDFDKGYDVTDFFKDGHTVDEFMRLLIDKSLYYYQM